jgi:hypothetical protein
MVEDLNLIELSNQSDAKRDQTWESAFLNALVGGSISIIEGDVQRGPDGWPYLWVETSAQGNEPTAQVLHWLSTRGIGLVVNPQKNQPDYVFTYGMIWNFREKGRFFNPASKQLNQGSVQIKEGMSFKSYQPSEEYFPSYARQILKEFLEQQGIKEPKLTLVDWEDGHTDLCFSVESLGSPNSEEQQSVAEAICWFLPQDYSVLIVSENSIKGFLPL